MKVFLQWTFRAFLFTLSIAIIAAIGQGFKNIHVVDGLLAVAGGGIFLGATFYFIEVKLIPWRKTRLIKKISRIFDSTPITETVTQFKMGLFDVYTDLEYNLTISQYQNAAELITFHIPRDQSKYLTNGLNKSFRASECNETLTYAIHQTNSMGLKRAKRKLEKILN